MISALPPESLAPRAAGTDETPCRAGPHPVVAPVAGQAGEHRPTGGGAPTAHTSQHRQHGKALRTVGPPGRTSWPPAQRQRPAHDRGEQVADRHGREGATRGTRGPSAADPGAEGSRSPRTHDRPPSRPRPGRGPATGCATACGSAPASRRRRALVGEQDDAPAPTATHTHWPTSMLAVERSRAADRHEACHLEQPLHHAPTPWRGPSNIRSASAAASACRAATGAAVGQQVVGASHHGPEYGRARPARRGEWLRVTVRRRARCCRRRRATPPWPRPIRASGRPAPNS